MADNYLEYSAFLHIPPGKIGRAKAIVERETAKLDAEDEWKCGGNAAEIKQRGVWFHGAESGDPDRAEAIARALVEELEIDEPFQCTWAYTCSKPRIDKFGGGALVVRRGRETIWIDALRSAQESDKIRLGRKEAA